MSKIIEKVFDVSKKIVRSVFKGAPNLITTDDLNRQIEALKYQLDALNKRFGFFADDWDISCSIKAGTLTVDVVNSDDAAGIEYQGCLFYPADGKFTINLSAASPYAYLCLVADTEEVTYNSDPSHEISGAKFADGTTMPAANQIRYVNERFSLSHYRNGVGVIGVLAEFRYHNGSVFMRSHIMETAISMSEHIRHNELNLGHDYAANLMMETTSKFPFKVGDTYDIAFGKIEKYLGVFVTENTGVWGYADDISNAGDVFRDLKAEGKTASMLQFGPLFMIKLKGLSRNESLSSGTLTENIKDLLFGNEYDANGLMLFDVPGDAPEIGAFLGATIGNARVTVYTTNKNEKASGIYVSSEYKGIYTVADGYARFSFISGFNNYSGISFADIERIASMGEGITVTLWFTNSRYFK